MADAKLRLEEMAQRQREGRDFHEDYSASTFLELIRRGMSKDQAAAPIVHDLDPLLRAYIYYDPVSCFYLTKNQHLL